MWAAMMRAALALGVGPEAFWRLSLKEWRMLTEAECGPGPMGRGRLDELMGRWPDSGPSPLAGEGGARRAATGG